jgi:hypothetical protein
MADLARALISKIINEKNLSSAASAGIRSDWFDDLEHRNAYKWITAYFDRYGEVPTPQALKHQYPNYELLKVPEPYDYYIDKFRNQHKRALAFDALLSANEALDRDDPLRALRIFEETTHRARMDQGDSDLSSVIASAVQPRRVSWIWKGRIPKGKLAVVGGDAGQGKTTMVMDIIARLSRGRAFPFSRRRRPSMKCLIMTAEDDPADTLVPRLIAAGADLDNVEFIIGRKSVDGDLLLSLPEDIPRIRKKVVDSGAGLLLIDPLNAFLNGRVDTYKDSDIRRVLAPLARLAEETGVAIVLILHLNKSSGGSALHRLLGSVGVGAAARAVLLVATNPENEDERVLAVAKVSNAPTPPSLVFWLEGTEHYGAAKAKWMRRSPFSADQLVKSQRSHEDTALGLAEKFLLDVLTKGGGRMPANKIKAEAQSAGISKATLLRAKNSLGVKSLKSGGKEGGPWIWVLPKAKQNAA